LTTLKTLSDGVDVDFDDTEDVE